MSTTSHSLSPRLRCAVYTRKSTEEGLDQEFNSLDAQHEACGAFIASQIGLGWKLAPERYDDGGISGGTMERPALQRLLRDIKDRRVDVVVVYKIDRLTRSLMDFSKIVEVFDANGVSFVSVTQQFNTTTSMGRLTLNVLLSFAQFEREVTAERIRDKIAASKKKGMWMGGVVPFGYRVESRKLLVNEAEAAIVRQLFRRYLESQSVRALVEEACDLGLSTRAVRRRDGSEVTTTPFGRGNLYHLLSNPIYVGKIRHREQVYDGEHEAIVERKVFDAAQALLASQAPARRLSTNSGHQHLLTGLLLDEVGNKLRSVHASKVGQRYRYYVSSYLVDGRRRSEGGWRLPAAELEAVVLERLIQFLQHQVQLAGWIQQMAEPRELSDALSSSDGIVKELRGGSAERQRQILRHIIHRIVLKPGMLSIDTAPSALVSILLGREPSNGADAAEGIFTIECPISLRRRGVEAKLILTDGRQQRDPDPALVNVVARAHRYLHQLTDGTGRTLTQVATMNATALSEVSRILPLAFLSPRITEVIVRGNQPPELTAQRLLRIGNFSHDWSDQAAVLGL